MNDLQQIDRLIADNCLDRALQMLDEILTARPDDAAALFARGKVYWRMGDRAKATGDYTAAAAIDPQSPAVKALENARDIENFYNTDLYNP